MMSCLLAVAVLTASMPGQANGPRDTAYGLISSIENHQWTDAERLFTSNATVTGVPSSEPEKKWTKTAKAFLAEKPNWCCRFLDSQVRQLDRAAIVHLDFRHAHLIFRCDFDLLNIDGEWKIDSFRFATRGDAKGAAEEMQKLRGTWQFLPAHPDNSILQELSLTLDRDEFKFDARVTGINLFGGAPKEHQISYRGWQVRIEPTAKQKTIEIEWDDDGVNDRIRVEYRLDGEQLTLKFLKSRDFDVQIQSDPDATLVLRRKQ